MKRIEDHPEWQACTPFEKYCWLRTREAIASCLAAFAGQTLTAELQKVISVAVERAVEEEVQIIESLQTDQVYMRYGPVIVLADALLSEQGLLLKCPRNAGEPDIAYRERIISFLDGTFKSH